jgi:hypothetical protein
MHAFKITLLLNSRNKVSAVYLALRENNKRVEKTIWVVS